MYERVTSLTLCLCCVALCVEMTIVNAVDGVVLCVCALIKYNEIGQSAQHDTRTRKTASGYSFGSCFFFVSRKIIYCENMHIKALY